MKLNPQLHWFVWIVALAACSAKPMGAPDTPLPNPPTKYATSPSLARTIVPIPSLTPTSVPTVTLVTQPAFENIKWAKYRLDFGITFEYPAEWITVIEITDWVKFSGYEGPVRVEVYTRPVEDRAVANPHSWGTNEGGYEVLWEKPISVENAEGLEFVWGQPSDNQVVGYLYAILYSERYELDVRLVMEAATVPTNTDQFRVFEHMVQSVRFAP